MRNFFKTIFASISSFDFYQEVPQKSFWRTLGFYAIFLILITLIRSIPVLFIALPRLQNAVSQSLVELRTHYPSNQVIEWDGAQVTAAINPQPVYYPQAFKNYFATEKLPPFLGIINTQQTLATPSADAIFTVTQTEIVTRAENNSVTQLPLSDVLGAEKQQLTPASITELQNYWEAHKHSFLHLIQVLFPFVLYFIILFQRLGMVLIESVLFMLFKKVQGKPWTYATAIKYAIHFFVAAEFIDIVAQYLYPQAAISLFSLTVWIYFIAISFFSTRKRLV